MAILSLQEKHQRSFSYIAENYREPIAKAFFRSPYGLETAVAIDVIIDKDFETNEKFRFFPISYTDASLSLCDMGLQAEAVANIIELARLKKQVLVLCQWSWFPEALEILEGDVNSLDDYQEFLIGKERFWFDFLPMPHCWASQQESPTTTQKPVKTKSKPEKELELELLCWLHSYGVKADNQIQSSRHRMDLWIPGKCFLELKRGKVSGDDVCQAIDYCEQRKKPIILVGNHISEMASRGIEAFNKAVDGEMLCFVSWSAVRTYLKGLLSL